MTEQDKTPIGAVIMDRLLTGDEVQAARLALEELLATYDGSVPFPEFVEHYMHEHPSDYDFRSVAQFIMPFNDPRQEVQGDICPLCGGVMASITHTVQASEHTELRTVSSGRLCYGHPAPKRHDGTLHGRNTYTVRHMFGLKIPKVASIKIGHEETTNDEVWLSPEQALSLLGWLQQEEDTLMHIIEARTKEEI